MTAPFVVFKSILFLNARGTHLNGPIQLPVTSFGGVVSFVGETVLFPLPGCH